MTDDAGISDRALQEIATLAAHDELTATVAERVLLILQQKEQPPRPESERAAT